MVDILWISPNLNHYKARFLNKLATQGSIRLTVLAGRSPVELGHASHDGEESFQRINVLADRNNFSFRPDVYIVLTKLILSRSFQVILMPAERKFLPLILYLSCMRFEGRYRIVTYNHPMAGASDRSPGSVKKNLVRFMFSLYDRVIFYTEKGRERAITRGLVRKSKAFFANNTLDTRDIWENYSFQVNESKDLTILFIGRLMPYRRLDILFDYFQELKRLCPRIRLVIIGDGPQSEWVQRMTEADPSIQWRGSIVDERRIAEEMRRAHLVFMPGASGLSVVHAFCYGKPYVTLASGPNHGPEIDYLVDRENGLLLKGDREVDCARIADLLLDREQYRIMCTAAFSTAQSLSVDKWCEKIVSALNFEEDQTR